THAHPGRALQVDATRALIIAELRSGDRTPIAAPTRTVEPKAAKSEPIIVIHRGSNRLYLWNGTRLVRTFAVATGQAIYPTPLGHFTIVVKEMNPWWYPPTQDAWAKGLKPVPPGPGNPLGTRWMGIDSPGVGIHGTDEPASIGYSESHGCIRMLVPDAEWLFDHVAVGTPVFIVPA
ncbi:MAG: L,D-transpeptidase, partial [Actinobacteria bacterium]|nr:L,D-transpeptidase [Actinomycetota bacterium]